MKLTTILLLITTLQVLAKDVYSQYAKLTLNLGETTVGQVLNEIENQSEFYFLFNQKLVDVDRKVNIRMTGKNVNEILEQVFNGTNIEFAIIDRQIVLSPSEYLKELNTSLQSITISGSVTDEDGLPLSGVSVYIMGITTGTITDVNGSYSLEVPSEDAVLVFSMIGYLSEKISVGSRREINVMLLPEITELNEVIVVGYGVQKKKLSTGATVHVDDEEIAQRHSLRIEQAIQGLTPGVHIAANSGQPGDGLKVRIRGVGTVGNSDPLYVVDGVTTGDIRYLNPSDVESVDILKDAASAAIYGARAANGVVLITTKKGRRGKMAVTYDGYYGWQNTPKRLDMLNGREYMELMNEASLLSEDDPEDYEPVFTQREIDSIGEGTDWQDYMFNKNVPVQNHSIGIIGGTDKTLYSSSLSYFNQNGIIGPEDRSKYERISIRLNTQNTLYKDILKVGENLVYSHSNINGVGTGNIWGGSNTVRGFLNATPIYSPYDPDSEDGYARSWKYMGEANPLALMNYANMSWEKQDRILGNVYAEVKIFKDLVFKTDFGIDLNYYYKTRYEPVYELSPTVFSSADNVEMEMGRNFTYRYENYLTYNKTFGIHHITLLAGNTLEKYNQFTIRGYKEDLIFDNLDYDDIAYALLDNATNNETQQAYGSRLERALFSYYGRVNYNIGEKYLFAGTIRMDGSSKFGPENRFGFFPSVSAGWVLSKSDILNFNFLNFFKIRASWGKNGNDKIGDFQYEALITSDNRDYYFGDDIQAIGSSPLKIHNPKIKWEESEQIDIGFDSRLFNGFSFNFDAYKKTTKNWLVIVPVRVIAGADPPTVNGGDVENKGLEFDFGYQKVNGDFTYNIRANVAFNKNEVTFIDNPEGVIHTERHLIFNQSDEDMYKAEVGYPIGYFEGYEMIGIFQNYDEINNYFHINEDGDTIIIQGRARPGDIKFKDQNEDGIINDEDKIMIGDPNPDVTFGISFDAQYKGWDISIFMSGVAGNQIIYGYRNWTDSYANYSHKLVDDRWMGEGTSNTSPRVTIGSSDNFHNMSKMFIKEGSYLKIRNLTIGHDLKQTVLKNIPVEQIRIYGSVSNLFTFTKYPGYDPEVGYGDYDANRYENFSTGVDIGFYPQPRTFMIGLNVKF